MPRSSPPVTALTIAGSDSGGGAGIQADLKTFLALGVHGASAITAITAQNTVGVRLVQQVPPDVISAQIAAVLDDLGAAAVKIGMLGSAEAATTVARSLQARPHGPVVLDPVMVATSGDRLLDDDAIGTLVGELFPQAALVTPNVPEAEALLGRVIDPEDEADSAAACRELLALGASAVLLKGGHARGPSVRDRLLGPTGYRVFTHPRRDLPAPSHGTGCTLSAAIAAHLALGIPLEPAVDRALGWLDGALAAARPVGAGAIPVNHGWKIA